MSCHSGNGHFRRSVAHCVRHHLDLESRCILCIGMERKHETELSGITAPTGEPTAVEVEALVRVLKRCADKNPEVRVFFDNMVVRVTKRLVREVMSRE